MNREKTRKDAEIMLACADGVEVEFAWHDNAGQIKDNFLLVPCQHTWNFEKFKYRIKPKPREFWLCWNKEDDGNFSDRFAYPADEFSKGAVNHWDNHIKVCEVIE